MFYSAIVEKTRNGTMYSLSQHTVHPIRTLSADRKATPTRCPDGVIIAVPLFFTFNITFNYHTWIASSEVYAATKAHEPPSEWSE